MRKRKTVGVPVQIYNLGSPAGAQMDFERDELWSRMDAEMGKKAVSLPVFLVNPNQMDMLYPREYRRALDPEQIRKLLQEEALREAQKREREQETGEWRERREEEPNFFDRLQRSEEDQIGWSKYSEVILVGLYLHLERCDQNFRSGVLRQGDSNAQTAEAANAFLNHQAPAIFLCCERIVDWASRVGVSHHLVMDKVYYHELGHGVMDTLPDGAPNPYFETWGVLWKKARERNRLPLFQWNRGALGTTAHSRPACRVSGLRISLPLCSYLAEFEFGVSSLLGL
jgi:hypothetical protein